MSLQQRLKKKFIHRFEDLTPCEFITGAKVCKDKQTFTLACSRIFNDLGLNDRENTTLPHRKTPKSPGIESRTPWPSHHCVNHFTPPRVKIDRWKKNNTNKLPTRSRRDVGPLFADTEILLYQAIIVYSESTSVLLSHRWHWQNQRLRTSAKKKKAL